MASKDDHRYRHPSDDTDAHTRKAFKQAFDAMAEWRDEIVDTTDKYGVPALDKLVDAAEAVGWPRTIVEATRSQLLQQAKMQSRMIDSLMMLWEDQLKAPVEPAQFLDLIAGPSGSTPAKMSDITNLAMTPTRLWLDATTMWQKSWSDAVTSWMPPERSSRSEREDGYRRSDR